MQKLAGQELLHVGSLDEARTRQRGKSSVWAHRGPSVHGDGLRTVLARSRRLCAGGTVMVGSHFRARAGTQKPGPARAVVAMPGVKRHRAEPSLLEIVFYKEILDHFGFPHRCELMRVPIPQTGPDMAILDAIRQFEREKRVSDWRIAADGYDVVSALTRER